MLKLLVCFRGRLMWGWEILRSFAFNNSIAEDQSLRYWGRRPTGGARSRVIIRGCGAGVAKHSNRRVRVRECGPLMVKGNFWR